jgi:hypothetical protein
MERARRRKLHVRSHIFETQTQKCRNSPEIAARGEYSNSKNGVEHRWAGVMAVGRIRISR